MNKKIAAIVSSATLMALPLVTGATLTSPDQPVVNNSLDAIGIVNKVLDFVWPIFIGFAVIMFIVAGFFFLTAQGDPSKVAQARLAILWGVIGIVVGVLAFSIPYVVLQTF